MVTHTNLEVKENVKDTKHMQSRRALAMEKRLQAEGKMVGQQLQSTDVPAAKS